MRRRLFGWICLFVSITLAAFAYSQEGHPLTGTWSGDWGTTPTQRSHVTFVMNWDGKNITGVMNPGPDAIAIGSVFLDVTNWTVRIEADAKDSGGKPVHVAAEGKLEDLGSYHRKISGVWRQGGVAGDFRITRD